MPKKKKRDPIKTTAEKEKEIDNQMQEAVNSNGLRLAWITFIEAYIKNGGNGTEAYKKAYPDVTDDNVAAAAASRLLRNVNVVEELNNKLTAQKCTDEFIYSGLIEIATEYRGAKTIHAAVKAYEILGKMKGLLVDTKKFTFTGDNPANVPPVVPKEKAKQIDGIIKGGGVIE